MTLHQYIKNLVDSLSISRTELRKRIGNEKPLAPMTLWRWENGKTMPSAREINLLAREAAKHSGKPLAHILIEINELFI